MRWCRIRLVLLGLSLCVVHVMGSTCGQRFTDPASSALIADVVIEGKVRKMAAPSTNVPYNITVAIRNTILKGRELVNNGRPAKTVTISKFQHGEANSTSCTGSVQLGRAYIFFLQRTGDDKGLHFQIVALPVKKAKKVLGDINKILCANCAQQASIATLTGSSEVEVGSKITLKCTVNGKPTPEFVWFKDGLQLEKKGRIKINTRKRQSTLQINRANMKDAGVYECMANNAVGEDRRSLPVKISGKKHARPCEAQTLCLNGGTCMYITSLEEHYCQCPKTFVGKRCEKQDTSRIMEEDPGKADMMYERTLVIVILVISVLVFVIISIASYFLAKKARKRHQERRKQREIRQGAERERDQPNIGLRGSDLMYSSPGKVTGCHCETCPGNRNPNQLEQVSQQDASPPSMSKPFSAKNMVFPPQSPVIMNHAGGGSSVNTNHGLSGSPASTNHGQSGLPASTNHGLSGSPASTNHGLSGSPASTNHGLSGSPSSTNHGLSRSPASTNHGLSRSPASTSHGTGLLPRGRLEASSNDENFNCFDRFVQTSLHGNTSHRVPAAFVRSPDKLKLDVTAEYNQLHDTYDSLATAELSPTSARTFCDKTHQKLPQSLSSPITFHPDIQNLQDNRQQSEPFPLPPPPPPPRQPLPQTPPRQPLPPTPSSLEPLPPPSQQPSSPPSPQSVSELPPQDSNHSFYSSNEDDASSEPLLPESTHYPPVHSRDGPCESTSERDLSRYMSLRQQGSWGHVYNHNKTNAESGHLLQDLTKLSHSSTFPKASHSSTFPKANVNGLENDLYSDTDDDDEVPNKNQPDLWISEEKLDLSREDLATSSFSSVNPSRQASREDWVSNVILSRQMSREDRGSPPASSPSLSRSRIRKHQSEEGSTSGKLFNKNLILLRDGAGTRSQDNPSLADYSHNPERLNSTVAGSPDVETYENLNHGASHQHGWEYPHDPNDDSIPWDAEINRRNHSSLTEEEEIDQLNRLKDVIPGQTAIAI